MYVIHPPHGSQRMINMAPDMNLRLNEFSGLRRIFKVIVRRILALVRQIYIFRYMFHPIVVHTLLLYTFDDNCIPIVVTLPTHIEAKNSSFEVAIVHSHCAATSFALVEFRSAITANCSAVCCAIRD